MSKILFLSFLFLTPIIFSNTVMANSITQCFEKHEFIETIDGSEHLPKKVCFSELIITDGSSGINLKIEGEPISGVFPLEQVMENDEINKQMTYILEKDHQKDGKLWGRVTLRVSVDLLKNTRSIDYTYLAAEFFVLRDDGAFDTHIYYYKRIKQ